MTLQETLKWDEYPVQIVALVAISQDEAKEFNDFFEMFIEIVSDPINVRLLAGAENFTEFILKMKMLVETEEWSVNVEGVGFILVWEERSLLS